MKDTKSFWKFFSTIEHRLAHRSNTFKTIFTYLDQISTSFNIIETGCARDEDNWFGDGCSTVLFDKYVTARDDGSRVTSVDISPQSIASCKKLVSENVDLIEADSVGFLHFYLKEVSEKNIPTPLFYLDSFDLDWTHWYPSAIHHLKELTSIHKYLKPETLVVVDDCMQTGDFMIENQEINFRNNIKKVGGKGRLVAEYALTVGAKLMFSSYHAGWIGFNSFK